MRQHNIFSISVKVYQKFRRPHMKWHVQCRNKVTNTSIIIFSFKRFSNFSFLIFIFNLIIVFDFHIAIIIFVDSCFAPFFLLIGILFGRSNKFFLVDEIFFVYHTFRFNLTWAPKLIYTVKSTCQVFFFFFLFFLVKFKNIWIYLFFNFFTINFFLYFLIFQFR